MNTFIRYLRLYLHQADGGKRPVGYLSQYGDILRVSFDRSYIEDPQRPTLSLAYRGADEAATHAILTAARDGVTLLKLARVPRASRLLQMARATVKVAQAEWPHLLDIAPDSMRRVVQERLKGGVALTQHPG